MTLGGSEGQQGQHDQHRKKCTEVLVVLRCIGWRSQTDFTGDGLGVPGSAIDDAFVSDMGSR